MDEDDLYAYSLGLEEMLNNACRLLAAAMPQVESDLCAEIGMYLENVEAEEC